MSQVISRALVKGMSEASDTYKAIALSTAHIDSCDKIFLTQIGFKYNLVAERESGFFVKLPEIDDDASDIEVWNSFFPNISESLFKILASAYLASYRMVEFDSSADIISTLKVYED